MLCAKMMFIFMCVNRVGLRQPHPSQLKQSQAWTDGMEDKSSLLHFPLQFSLHPYFKLQNNCYVF